jgi:hypothetical protein
LSYIRSRRPPLLAVWARTTHSSFRPAPRPSSRVVSLGTYSGKFKKTGRSMSAAFAHVWTVRGDKVARFNMHTGLFLVWDLAGPSAIDGGDYGFGSRRSHPGPAGQ